MTITFSQTGREMVTGAMHELGILSLDDVPDAAELDYGIEQLNLILKGLAAEGVTPWTDVEATVAFATSASTVTLDPRPLGVLEARLEVSSTYQRPLTRWSNGEYDEIPNKAQTGQPLTYEVLQTATAMQMRVWPVPDKAYTVAYSYQRVIEDIDENTNLDVPQVWHEAVRALLKTKMTPFMPQGVPQHVLVEAEMRKRKLLDYDRPESYMIEPDRYA